MITDEQQRLLDWYQEALETESATRQDLRTHRARHITRLMREKGARVTVVRENVAADEETQDLTAEWENARVALTVLETRVRFELGANGGPSSRTGPMTPEVDPDDGSSQVHPEDQ